MLACTESMLAVNLYELYPTLGPRLNKSCAFTTDPQAITSIRIRALFTLCFFITKERLNNKVIIHEGILDISQNYSKSKECYYYIFF